MSIRAFVQAVMASIVAYYVCKWLDSCTAAFIEWLAQGEHAP